MRLDIFRQRGGGLGGMGVLICSLLWGTALGMRIQDTRLLKREPQPQGPPPPVTVWVTVSAQGGWMVTEFTTMTITPSTTAGASGPTSIATVTSTMTTATTVTNTITVQSTTTQTNTQTTEATVTGTTEATGTNSATTGVVTGQPTVTTITSFVVEPAATNWTGTWAQGAPVVRREVIPETVTSTTTLWDWASGTTTSTVTITATPNLNNFLVQTSMALLTTTLVTTQISTFTTEQTVTASSTPSPTGLVVDEADPVSSQSGNRKTPNVEIILGASFGALVGFVGIFVLAYLWAKKRRDEKLRTESVGFSNNDFSRSTPAAGAAVGVRGMLGSLRRGSSAARYNNLPTTESVPNMSPLPAPPHSPPPQLPSLRVNPPSGEFNYDYTFGSPVSSIDEAQLHALTSGGSINRMGTPPPEPPTTPNALFYTLSRQNEEPPWRTGAAVTENVATETVVSSVSAESERIGSLRRKPLPGSDLVSP